MRNSANGILVLKKEIGETPLEVINAYKEANPDLKDVKMAYAGRLDPMAEGLLLVLVGDECKNRDEYQNMTKIYEFDVLLGISTDTYDTLGIIDAFTKKDIATILPLKNLPKELGQIIDKVSTLQTQEYPAYSSYHVDGKPLWWWAKNNKLDEIEMPSKEIKVINFKVNRVYEISASDLLQEVQHRTKLVSGDFRQESIIKSWHSNLASSDAVFPVLSFEIEVTSGTYVRSIAKQIGDWLNLPALAYRIKRTKVGGYMI